MIWVIYVLIAIVAIIAAAALIGATRPKAHSVTRIARLHQSVEAVWALISDHLNDSAWRSDVKTVEQLADREGHQVFKETYKNGQVQVLETTEEVRPQKLVRKIVDNKQFSGVWTIVLTPADTGCTISTTEDGEIYNPIFRFVFMFLNPGGTIEKYLGNVAAKFGEGLDLVN